MSTSAKATHLPPEFAGMMRLANYYLPVHVREGHVQKFISKTPETDLKVSRQAALEFALNHRITYYPSIIKTTRPLLTIIKDGDQWFPAELYPDKTIILRRKGPMRLGSPQARDTNYWTNVIAQERGTVSIVNLGIFLSNCPY
jgi:hypothetical protein